MGGWIDGHVNRQQVRLVILEACIHLSVPLQWWKVTKYLYSSTVLKYTFHFSLLYILVQNIVLFCTQLYEFDRILTENVWWISKIWCILIDLALQLYIRSKYKVLDQISGSLNSERLTLTGAIFLHNEYIYI